MRNLPQPSAQVNPQCDAMEIEYPKSPANNMQDEGIEHMVEEISPSNFHRFFTEQADSDNESSESSNDATRQILTATRQSI